MTAATATGACDIAIVGGGLVGASLALALRDLPLEVAVIEAVPPQAGGQPSFDARTTALSNGTRRILTALQQAGALPESSRSTLGDTVNSLATIAAKLAETDVANR